MEHLQRVPHKLLEEYFLAKRQNIQHELEYRWVNSIGKDISDILRGKLEVIDTFLNLKDIFKQMDDVEKKIKELQDKENKNKGAE